MLFTIPPLLPIIAWNLTIMELSFKKYAIINNTAMPSPIAILFFLWDKNFVTFSFSSNINNIICAAKTIGNTTRESLEADVHEIYIKNAEITNGNGEVLFSNKFKDNQTNMIFFDRWINKNNFIIIYKLDNLKNIKEYDKIKIKVNEIYVENSEYSKNLELQDCEFLV